MSHYDTLETRSPEARADELAKALPEQIGRAQGLPGYAGGLSAIDASTITDAASLAKLPVLRKSHLAEAQKTQDFGGFAGAATTFDQVFQSPGPIYEPGNTSADWWRFGRFLHACGIGQGDIVQNCFSYHFTPAGLMFENGARAVGATVFPAGIGQTEAQARAAAEIGCTAYAGTPDFLKHIIEMMEAEKLPIFFKKAAVSGGALFPSLRDWYTERGITCLQAYGTADLGNIAYETTLGGGMIVEERVVVEIVTPGTGDPVPAGEVGEVVVTTLNPDYPLIRFATGDMSAVMAGQSPCGRTNMRIKGWMGRADQTTKIKGMFVRPEQVAELVAKLGVDRARVIADRDGENDTMVVQVEATADPAAGEAMEDTVREVLKLRGRVEVHGPGDLPRDGLVIEDRRTYET